MNQEKGNWKPYNVGAITSNIELIFKKQDISKLNKPTYNFIVSHMGFIAHYSLEGFQQEYKDLRKFIQTLQTSEYSQKLDHNLKEANRLINDEDFREWYGEDYNKSKSEAIRLIIDIAKRYAFIIDEKFTSIDRSCDLLLASRLAGKHGYKLEKGE